jgi:hypothetical protein
MIPLPVCSAWPRTLRRAAATGALLPALALASPGPPPAAGAAAPAPPASAAPAGCIASGDGYLRAHLAGAIDADIDWPNSGTRCEGESKTTPAGVRMSFSRVAGGTPDLLFVFGLTGVNEGRALSAGAANVTIIEQGSGRIFGTLGDSRCTIDSLRQRRMAEEHTYRIEARGFCTQPARAIRGPGEVLLTRFDFAGQVTYFAADAAADP